MKPIIETNNLTVKYGKNTVLKDISITVPKGKITVVLGESGCGKSTLVKSILKLIDVDSGQIKLFENNIDTITDEKFNEILKKIGMLFQNGALLDSLTVFENIAIPLKHHTELPEEIIERIIKVKLRLVKLKDIAYKKPAELSGGMRKRVALARAIALDPELLFCDEPSAGLDPNTKASLDNLLIDLRNQLDMTMLVVTHELTSVKRIADRIIFINEGNILYQGDADEIENTEIDFIQDFFSKG